MGTHLQVIDKSSAIKSIILCVLLMISISINAATYYFSSSIGSDNYTAEQAQNQATPWQTINKLNAIMSMLHPGDMVLFKRGDIFSGTITVGASGTAGHPIAFSAYGSGTSKVILDNRLTLSGWTNLGGNIWEASNAALQSLPSALFIDNKLTPLGRYPNIDAANGGYLTVSSHPAGSKTVFTDNTLSASPNWTGAEVVLRNDHYLLSRVPVVSQSGQTITLSNIAQNGIRDKFGYFIQNIPAALDKDGEWCYIAATQKIRLYSISDPNTKVIKVANTDNYFNISSKSYLVIDGFAMCGAKKCAAKLIAVTYCTIKNCEFIASGTNALNIGTFGDIDNDSISIVNNIFTKTQSNCINAFGKRLAFIGNTFKNTGTVPGMAENGQCSVGMNLLADGLNVERNVFDSIGNSAIMFLWSSNVLIKENSVNHFCSVLDDEGGIYCYRSPNIAEPVNRKIINNIVLNGMGAKEGTDGSISLVEGIYIDDCSTNVEIIGNTVAFCTNSGIFLHNSPKCTVKNNTVYSCKQDLFISHDNNAPTFPVINCDIQNNLFASIEQDATKSQLILFQTIDGSSLANLGTLDNNIYCQPFLTSNYIDYNDESSSSPNSLCLNLAEWKKFSGYDLHSVSSPITFPAYSKLLSSNGIINSAFGTNLNNWSAWDPENNSSALTMVSGQLDGSCLAFTVTGTGGKNSSRLETTLPPITAGKTYMLKFSVKSTVTGSLKLYLIQNTWPYPTGSAEYYVNICSDRAEKGILITSTTTLASPSIFIMSGPENGVVYLDNIEFYEVTPTNPDDYFRFEYNTTAVARNIVADRNWITPAGVNYASGSSITIPPFGSVVLLKNDVATGISPDIPAKKKLFSLYPNPTTDKLFIQTEVSNSQVDATLFDISGKVIRNQTIKSGSYMDVQALPPGVYIVRVVTNNQAQALKFIKR